MKTCWIGILGLTLAWGDLHAGDNDLEIRALLAPKLESTLSSQIAARIEKINVTDGEPFQRGKTLVQFDCAVPNAQLQKAAAEHHAAEMQLEANQNLIKHNAIGHLEVAIAQAEVDKSRAQMQLMQAKVKMCKVDAPFSGRTVKLLVHPYQSIREGTPLVEILDDQKLKMELIVPSHWLHWLKPGARFQVHIEETGKHYPAVITMLGARVDPVSQTLAITAEITGKHRELLTGMSGIANLSPPSKP